MLIPLAIKISIFVPQGRLVAPIYVKFSVTKGHVGPLGQTKFHAYWFTVVGTRPPKWQKFPLFGRVAGANPLTDLYSNLLGFIGPTILH